MYSTEDNDEINNMGLDHDKLIELVVSGEMFIDDLPSEEISLETLEEVYTKLGICSIAALEFIKTHNLNNKKLIEEDIVDYSEDIAKVLLKKIALLHSTDDKINGCFEENGIYSGFLTKELDSVIEEILENIKNNKKWNGVI